MILTSTFWSQALQRAVRTFAQTAIAAIGVGTTNLFSADVKNILALSVSSAVLSILMSIDRTSGEPSAAPEQITVEVEPVREIATFAAPPITVGCGDSLK